MPQIINFHHYHKDPDLLTAEFSDNWMYVGRENRGLGLERSPLANPFVSDAKYNGRVVKDPVAAYRRWLWQQVVNGNQAIMSALAKINEATALVCWCSPKDCHADVIASAWAYFAYAQFEGRGERPSQAISIRQPWAWLIVRPDVVTSYERGQMFLTGEMKNVENRTWRTQVRGPVFIHAAKTVDKVSIDHVRLHWPHIQLPYEYQTGGIVGRANLLDCVRNHGSRWRVAGQNQFVLSEIRPLSFQETPGRLNFFEVDYRG